MKSFLLKIAAQNPSFRKKLISKLSATTKPKKKLTGKKLEKAVEDAYYKHGRNIQVRMMDTPKIYKAGEDAYNGAVTAEEAEKALDEAMKAAIEKYKIA